MHTAKSFTPITQGIVHPEQQGDREYFLGNFDPVFVVKTLRVKWGTLRVGKIAYDEQGRSYPDTMQEHLRPVPVFVERNEALKQHYALMTTNRVNVPASLLKEIGLNT